MSKRTWFKHRCWFCGHVSRDVVPIFSYEDVRYQCSDRGTCDLRSMSRACRALLQRKEPA